MKRLLILVLALTLCFAGCKEEPKMPDTPEVEHTEEVKAPIEETPEEPDGIEPVEEIPDEPKDNTLTEPTEKPDENVIILPEPDENTKVITIEFPEDFPEEPYTEPELVSPEEFEWGEYVPFVKYYHSIYYELYGHLKYSFLGQDIKTLEEGTALYDKLNNKYLITQEIPENLTWFSQPANTIEGLLDAIYNSHIIYVSSDASEIVRLSYVDTKKEKRESKLTEISENIFSYGWKSVLDTFIGGNLSSTKEKTSYVDVLDPAGGYYGDGSSLNASYVHSWGRGELSQEIGERYTGKLLSYTEEKIIAIYDAEQESILYVLTLPKTKDIFDLIHFADDSVILRIKNHFYKYNLDTKEYTYIDSCTENVLINNILLSPDGNYVAYKRDVVSEDSSVCAVIVKNLTSDKATAYNYELITHDKFFDRDKFYSYNIINWVNKEKLLDIVK